MATKAGLDAVARLERFALAFEQIAARLRAAAARPSA